MRIVINPEAKELITQAFVEGQHPAGLNGVYYTDGNEVWFRENTAPWNPWPDNRKVVKVWTLFTCADIGVDESAYVDEKSVENAVMFFLAYLADEYQVYEDDWAWPIDT